MSELEDKYGIYDIDADGVFPTPQKYLAAREITPSTDFEALGKAYANAYKNYAKASGFPEWQQDAYADDLAATYFSGVVNKEAFDANYAARTGTAPPTPAQPTVQDRGRRIALDGSQNSIPESNYNLLSEMNPSAYPALPDTDPGLWQSVKRGALGMVAGLEASAAAEGYSNAEKLQRWAPGLADLNRTLAGGSESRAVDLVRAQSTIPSHPGLAEFAKTQGFFDAAGFLVTNPTATANLFAESAPQMVPQMGASMVGGSLAGFHGAIAAGFGTSYELNQASKTLEELQASGKALPAALQDPTIRDPATAAASRYALPVAAAESIGLGLAAKAPLTLGSIATQALAVQPASAGIGEVGGQLAAHPDRPITWRDVAAEMVLEVPFGATETMIHAGKYGTAAPPAAGQPPPAADPNANVGNPADPNAPTGPSADPFDAARNATRQARTATAQQAATDSAAQAEQDKNTLNALMARIPAIRQGAETQTKLEAEIAALEQQQAMDTQFGLGATQQAKDAAKALTAKQKELAKLGDQRAALQQMEGLQGQIESRTQGSGLSGKIIETANALGMDPVDLATIISYETAGTFDPRKRGPTTQWGQHRGLIQFGEPQAKEYGVDWNDPINSQLGANGAVVKYFRANGWKPGMPVLDAYSIVNAGAPGKYNASDANNGGARGTVRDKVENQFAPHRSKAEKLLRGELSTAGGNSRLALPSQAQPHPDDVYLVDRAGNATIQPFKPILNPTTDEAQAGVEPFKPISNPATAEPATAEPATGTQPAQQPTGAAPQEALPQVEPADATPTPVDLPNTPADQGTAPQLLLPATTPEATAPVTDTQAGTQPLPDVPDAAAPITADVPAVPDAATAPDLQDSPADMAARTANPVDTEAVIAGIQTGDIPIQLYTKAGKPVSKQPTHEEVVKAHAAKKPTKRQQDIIAEVEPKSNAEMRETHNIRRLYQVSKGPDSVEYGEKWLDDLDAIYIDPLRTPNIAREFENIDYQTDKDGNPKARLEDKDNHAIDATRYAFNDDMYAKIDGKKRAEAAKFFFG